MPSPDVSGSVDLVIYDKTAAELVDAAVLAAQTVLPEASFPDGSIEMTLLESLSLIVAELVYGINRIPGAVLESLLTILYGIARSSGVAPTATVTFTAGASGASIPANTLVQLGMGDALVIFATNTELTLVAGTGSGTVAVTGTTLTDTVNGRAVGTPLTVVSATTGVTGASLATAVAGGAGPEDANAYLDRASNRLARLTDTLVVPAHFTAYALEQPGVYRAVVIDAYLPPSGTPGTNAGHVTVAVLSSSGAVLSAGAKTALETAMDAKALASLAVHVIDPTITAVPVTATVKALTGYTTAAVQASCVAALQGFLSPLTWTWGSTLRRNDLIALLENVPGVDYVTAGHPTAPAADVALAGVAPLASAGVLTITAT